MKHHWWWKLNRIFDELRVTRNRKGMLLLLEEDYFVASDFLHTFKLMQEKVPKMCPQCNLMSLGTYSQSINQFTSKTVDISPWITSKHNMGMALNKSTWLEVRKCGASFCNYDEYNYDFSFQNVNRKCLKNHFFIALIRGPRIFHVGECGVHHAKTNCDVDGKINEINSELERAWRDNLLYPLDLNVGTVDLNNPSSVLINNGGWADRRDHCLCNSVINTNGREVDLQKCRDLYEKRVKVRNFKRINDVM
jgi:alpha-1,6-mannosyl-glycoprotein beta-1,2-N-acetylglucosaminyltransferase